MKLFKYSDNPVLFGADSKEGIVAVEASGSRAMVYVRTPDRGVLLESDYFSPFLFLESENLLSGWSGGARFESLDGRGEYKCVAIFAEWKELLAALKFLKEKTGCTPGVQDGPFFHISDPVQQYLMSTGRTLYKGLAFEDLNRFQLDIETTVSQGYEFPSAAREGDRITLISLSDSSGWEESIRGDLLSEPEMLEELTRIIRERNPDVIEGHNIFNFDLPYIETRARRFSIKLPWGRDGSTIKSRPSRFGAAERIINFKRFDIHGRHIIDTLFLAHLYDINTRSLESRGLKAVARHLGVAPENRTYVDHKEIPDLFETDMETLTDYGLDDVRETREVSRMLGQSHFYQTQMFPYKHQDIVVRATATRIDALFLRECLRQRRSFPKPPKRESFEGGYADIFITGVVRPVSNCDIRSLYPSLMLSYGISPEKDELGIFSKLLGDLTRLRLEGKERARQASDPEERALYDAYQGTFKVLINSFYGYLAFPLAHFGDFGAAAKTAGEGRALLRRVLKELEKRGARPVEVDTDGVYFAPPTGAEDDEALIAEINKTLPKGIVLETGGRFSAMFSYKVKNYVLLTPDGKMRIKGSGLRSRGMEKFQREFMKEMFRAILEERPEGAADIKRRYMDDLKNHRWSTDMFAKTETLHDSLDVYMKKREKNARNRSAAYELAFASGRPFQPGDQITYYVTGNKKNVKVYEAAKPASQWDAAHPDENAAYYAAKLEALYRKFKPFFKGSSASRSQTLALF